MLNEFTSYGLLGLFAFAFGFVFSYECIALVEVWGRKKQHPHRNLHSAAGKLTGHFYTTDNGASTIMGIKQEPMKCLAHRLNAHEFPPPLLIIVPQENHLTKLNLLRLRVPIP